MLTEPSTADLDNLAQRLMAGSPVVNVPKRVRIGAVDYVVKLVAHLSRGQEQIDGRAYNDLGVILIRAEMSPQLQLQTLWHEIVHAIVYQGQLGHFKLGDERAVDPLAWGILQVVRDNPGLAKGQW